MTFDADPKARTATSAPRRTRFARVVIGLWLAVHAIVVAGAPVADGFIGHGTVVPHWEDAQDTSCPPQHDLDGCQLCHPVAKHLVTGPVRAVAPPTVVRVEERRIADRGTGASEAARRGAPDPRGPPQG